jgi:PBP1b-binding outer membrane lipoprotein LpoB
MFNRKMILVVLLLAMAIVACSNQATPKEPEIVLDNPTPEEILAENENADIFVLNGIVYSNAEDIEWVNEKELTLGEEVGEIKKQTSNSDEFENYTATLLPVGTKIYQPVEKGDIYIVRVDGKEIRYLGLREG